MTDELLRKLLKSDRPNRLIACNYIAENMGFPRFIKKWLKDDPKTEEFKPLPTEPRVGLFFDNRFEENGRTDDEFYYKYAKTRYVISSEGQLIICFKPYARDVEVFNHE